MHSRQADSQRFELTIWVGLRIATALAAVVFTAARFVSQDRAVRPRIEHGTHVHAQAPAEQTSADAARPRTNLSQLSCDPLANAPGKSIRSALVDFPPHAFTPQHRHPGSVLSFILKGQVRSQLNGESPSILSVGETLFEPPGTIHLFAENPSLTDPAQLLSIFVTDGDCGPLIMFD